MYILVLTIIKEEWFSSVISYVFHRPYNFNKHQPVVFCVYTYTLKEAKVKIIKSLMSPTPSNQSVEETDMTFKMSVSNMCTSSYTIDFQVCIEFK